ncbi:hypothetical protein MTR67_032180, partial [Solanum verrucosum]
VLSPLVWTLTFLKLIIWDKTGYETDSSSIKVQFAISSRKEETPEDKPTGMKSSTDIMSNHRLPGKSRRMGPIMGHTMHYKRMIVTLHQGPFFLEQIDEEDNNNLNSKSQVPNTCASHCSSVI